MKKNKTLEPPKLKDVTLFDKIAASKDVVETEEKGKTLIEEFFGKKDKEAGADDTLAGQKAQPEGPEENKSRVPRYISEDKKMTFLIVPFAEMKDYENHPFRLYEGERKDDMVESIREKGILQPIVLRPNKGGAEAYEILAGHNRKYCGIEAGLAEGPSLIKEGLTDDEAYAYVIESNLLQRSFSDLLPSEKAEILYHAHKKIFSQGKRNDIKKAIETGDRDWDFKDTPTSGQYDQKLHSREKIGLDYGLASKTVARFLKIYTLDAKLKQMLDEERFGILPAVCLSYLTASEQKILSALLSDGYKLTVKNSEALKDAVRRKKASDLSEAQIADILTGKKKGSKEKKAPPINLKRDIYYKFFKADTPKKEVLRVIEEALEKYYAEQTA
jgi:ParB family chromosome partitioning protein